jgi:hypothetical protein
LRESLLEKLKGEIEGRSTVGGPVIFEIPEGTDTVDVLVVWENKDWAELRSEDRASLILDAYGDRRQRIAQALGVTPEEAVQEQFLPYAVVSAFEQNPKFASLACGGNQSEIEKLLADIRDAKRSMGGIVLPHGKIELRFPTRAMADSTYAALFADAKYRDFYWSVVPTATSVPEPR